MGENDDDFNLFKNLALQNLEFDFYYSVDKPVVSEIMDSYSDTEKNKNLFGILRHITFLDDLD